MDTRKRNNDSEGAKLAIARDRLLGIARLAETLEEAREMAKDGLNLTGCFAPEKRSICPECGEAFEDEDRVYNHRAVAH